MTDPEPISSGDSPEEIGRADVNQRLTDLLVRSARGEEAAFAELYDATAPRVHGLVLRVVRDPAQAEEVTQEVFLQIWQQAGRFDASRGTSALAWMMTVAHRRAVDRVRSAEAVRRHDSAPPQHRSTVDEDTTADAAAASWAARRVRAALESLTPIQRQAVELAYFGGYTHTEVAGLLNLPLGTAKTRIRDGMIRLRDAMGVTR